MNRSLRSTHSTLPTLLFLMLTLVFGLPSDLLAGGPRSALGSTARSYPANAFPLTYRYDRGGLGAFSNGTAKSISDYAFAQWAAVAGSGATFTNGGQLARDVTTATDGYISGSGQYSDGINPVVFDSSGTITDDRLGQGASNSVLGFAGSAYFTNGTNYIEGYVIINGKLTGTGSASDRQEYEATVTHEVGHFLGMAHSQIGLGSRFPTMYPSIVDPAGQRTLDADDAAAFALIYPNGTFLASVGKISGTVKTSGGSALSGLNVVARNTTSGATFSTVVDYFSGGKNGFNNPPTANGSYTLDGLPAGSYVVRVEPINSNFTGGSSVASYNAPINTGVRPEWYNGNDESGDMLEDNANATTTVSVTAGATTSNINITENRSSTTSSMTEHNGNRWGIISLPNGSVTRYAIRYTAPRDGSILGMAFKAHRSSSITSNDSLRITLHENQQGSLAGIPGTVRGSVTLPYNRINADQENFIWLRSLGADANFSSGDRFHIAFSTTGGGPLKLEIDNGTSSSNQSSYYVNGTWRNFDDGYNAGYNLVATAIYSSSAVSFDQPEIDVAPSSIDYGRLRVGRTAERSVTVRNNGSGTLSLVGTAIEGPDSAEFRVSAGGSSGDLAPGGSRTITVRFAPNTGGGDMESGSKSATLRIWSNDPNSPTLVPLTGQAVRPSARLTITSLDFGSQRVGTTARIDTVVLTNPCTDTLRIGSITLSGTDATAFSIASGGSTTLLPPDSSLRLVTTFSPTATRSYGARIQITHDDELSGGVSEITLSGQGVAPQLSTPAGFDFGDVPVGMPAEEDIVVGNIGSASLTLSSLELTGENAADFMILGPPLPATIAGGEERAVTLRFTPKARGRRVATLRVETESGDAVTILIEGNGLAGELTLSPTSIDFGQVEVDGRVDRSVTITNRGNSSTTISSLSATAPFTVLTNVAGQTLAPGASLNATVRFAPTTSGIKTGELVLRDQGSAVEVTTTLRGEGTSADLAVDQSLIDYGIVRIGGTYYRVFVVRNTGQVLLQRLDLSFSGDAATQYAVTGDTEIDLAPGDSALVEIAWTPDRDRENSTARLSIGDGSRELAGVDFQGMAFERIADFPGIIDFAERRTNRSYDTTLTITNDGPIPLRIESYRTEAEVDGVEGEYFQLLSGLPIVIGAGQEREIPIRFLSKKQGSYSGTITLVTDSPVDSTIVMTFFANVVDSSSTLGVAVAGENRTLLGASLTPNPTKDRATVTLRMDRSARADVRGIVVDELGRIRGRLAPSDFLPIGGSSWRAEIDAAELESGHYFVVIYGAGETATVAMSIVR